jgi:hypothetical protein
LKRNPISLFGDLWQAAGIYHPNQVRILLHRWDKAGDILALKKWHVHDPPFLRTAQRGSGIYFGINAVLARASISFWS